VLRDKMVVSLEKGRNSLRPITEIAYQYKATFFLDELRRIDNELSYLIDKVRSSPSGVDRKQITQVTKFDAIYVDSCDLISDQLDNLYGKIIQASLNFQPFVPELFSLRKIVVDLENAYGGRINAVNQANLTLYSMQKKLNKDDLKAMGESLEDLKQIAQENDDVANRLANSIITQAPEISKQMEALKASGQKSPAVSGALKKWGEISGLLGVATVAATTATATGQVKTAVTNAKMIVTGVVEIASLLGAVAVPGLPIVATAAKSILGILGRSI
jgi:DNA repair exonuclease SbcCD ATPase subunit